ncbi:GNAT family N-acetyltransferase [Streptomyces monticola]|uniref:GNAT family N-acetyltransferase n=1 Tax=Streptomyces monticola TaxID=2666263 RepID=A0ABW2JKE4_9ACTN
MKIVDIDPADPRLEAVFPVLQELRPHLTAEEFRALYEEGRGTGLQYTAAFGDDGSCLGVIGWHVVVTTVQGRTMYVDDLVVSAAVRSGGVGRALLGHVEERAREGGCNALRLDSGTQRVQAHRFYMREGLTIGAFHFIKPLNG